MKTKIHKPFVLLPLSMAVLFMLHSCTLYKNTPTTSQEAIRSENNVLIKSAYHDDLKFKRIIVEEGKMVGLAKKHSPAAQTLQGEIIGQGEKKNMVKIELEELAGKQYFLKDKTKSLVMSIAMCTLLAIPLIGIYALATSSDGDGDYKDEPWYW